MIYRNKKILERCRELPCQICGMEDGTVVAAHSNQLRDGKGKGMKAHDYRVAALCYHCHMEIDQGKKWDKSEKMDFWDEAHRRTIGQFFERGWLDVT